MSDETAQAPRWIALATNLFALWTVLGVAWAWLVPAHFAWVAGSQIAGQPLISVMLGAIMLGMGLTLTVEDFRKVLAMPRCVAAGVVLQFTVMPLAGVMAAMTFGLDEGLAVGLILVACCPGGTASNVVTYLARANVALSVAMTLCSTLVAIVASPLLTGWLAGVYVEIDQWSLFRGMVSIVLIPVVAGVLLNTLLPQAMRRVAVWSPLVSIVAIVLIVGAIVGNSKALIIENAGVLLLAVFMLHAVGFAIGWLAPRLFGFGPDEQRTISIEVGMQNSGLGASLASQASFAAQFANPLQAALAPVPSAISSVYHVVIGSILAGIWARTGRGGQ
jgi:BASS family bile acid:Na+ symporter